MSERNERLVLPVLPLREVVLFPGVTAPIGAGRPGTLRAIEAALTTPDKLVFAVSQRENVEQVNAEGLYTIGTIARIGQMQRGLAGMQLLLHGERRGIAMHVRREGRLPRRRSSATPRRWRRSTRRTRRSWRSTARRARAPPSWARSRACPRRSCSRCSPASHEPGRFADLVAGYIDIAPPQRQALLETLSVEERLRRVLVHVQRQIGVLDAQEDIKSQVQEELGERQREMFLREQLKAIRKELGEDDERRRPGGTAREARRARAARGGAQGSRPRARPAGADRPRVDGIPGHPHLPRDRRRAAVEHPQRGASRPRRGAERSSTRITTASAT